ncbi:MAG: hypothetical protein A2901_06520 [Elusimicrobia bacterium RIFCSPLOWO2_01_FULL_54_10]|nr:MAG: hypothetical protein A2901_06520 [Elusimicrobia bacterium RIFCSPLOWO2_01_FULL_54_10]
MTLPPSSGFVRSCAPFDGALKELIHQLKYSGKDYLARDLAPVLMEGWRRHPEIQLTEIVVSVPLHPARLRERGYNQSEALAREMARLARVPFLDALKRARNTVSQTQLDSQERAKNVAGVFQVRTPGQIAGKRVLLVDDVCTTGSTLGECAQALLQAGARQVFALTLARKV